MTEEQRHTATGQLIENHRKAKATYLLLQERARKLGENFARLGAKLQSDPTEIETTPQPETIYKFNERIYHLDFEVPSHNEIVRLVAEVIAAKAEYEHLQRIKDSIV